MNNKNVFLILAALGLIYYFNKNKNKPSVKSAKADLVALVNQSNFVEDKTTMKDLYLEGQQQCKY